MPRELVLPRVAQEVCLHTGNDQFRVLIGPETPVNSRCLMTVCVCVYLQDTSATIGPGTLFAWCMPLEAR